MKTDWSKWSLTSDPTTISSDCYMTTTTNDDIQSAIESEVKRRMEMEDGE